MRREKHTSVAAAESPGVLEIGLWIVAAGAPLAWSQAVFCEYTLPKLIAITCGGLLAAVGLALRARTAGRCPPNAVDWALLAWLAAGALATLRSQDIRLSLVGQYNLYTYALWQAALYSAVFFIAARCADERAIRRILRVCLGTAAVVALYSLMQGLGIEPFTLSAPLFGGGRAVSTIGSPVHLGAYLALLTPLAIHELRLAKGAGRVLAGLCLILLLGGLWATISRGAWLVAAVGALAYAVFTGVRPRWSLGKWLAAALLAAAVCAALSVKLAKRPVSKSDIGRKEAWRVAWLVFREHPLLGTGPDTFGENARRYKSENFVHTHGVAAYHADAHNDVLEALSTTGLLGALAYLCVIAALCWEGIKALKDPARQGMAAALCAGLLALFVNMKFNPISLEVAAVAAVLAGLLSAGNRVGLQDKLEPSSALRVLWAGVIVAFLGGSTWAALHLSVADRDFQMSRKVTDFNQFLAHWRRAQALNRCETTYDMMGVNVLTQFARKAPASPSRDAWLSEAAQAGEKAVNCHPASINSHYIYGFVSVIQAQMGQKDKLPIAERELDAAMGLDPYFDSLISLRREAALLRGDSKKAEELGKRLEAVAALIRRP